MTTIVGSMTTLLKGMVLYSRKWSLYTNTRKTKIMTTSNGYKFAANEVWAYDGVALKNVKYFEYLKEKKIFKEYQTITVLLRRISSQNLFRKRQLSK